MIDITKKYRTRDGREAQVLKVDGGDWGYPVIATYKDANGHWWPLHLTKDGRVTMAGPDKPLDLIEVKPRIQREVWVNVYRHDGHMADEFLEMHDSRASADMNTGDARIACVKLVIDCEEGEGL